MYWLHIYFISKDTLVWFFKCFFTFFTINWIEFCNDLTSFSFVSFMCCICYRKETLTFYEIIDKSIDKSILILISRWLLYFIPPKRHPNLNYPSWEMFQGASCNSDQYKSLKPGPWRVDERIVTLEKIGKTVWRLVVGKCCLKWEIKPQDFAESVTTLQVNRSTTRL